MATCKQMLLMFTPSWPFLVRHNPSLTWLYVVFGHLPPLLPQRHAVRKGELKASQTNSILSIFHLIFPQLHTDCGLPTPPPLTHPPFPSAECCFIGSLKHILISLPAHLSTLAFRFTPFWEPWIEPHWTVLFCSDLQFLVWKTWIRRQIPMSSTVWPSSSSPPLPALSDIWFPVILRGISNHCPVGGALYVQSRLEACLLYL